MRADVTGRRSSTSQKKLSTPQVRTKAARAAGSVSDQTRQAERRQMKGGKSTTGRRVGQVAVAKRFLRKRTAGGMTQR